VFLKDGGFALLSLGFAPSFVARTALAAAGRRKHLIAIFQRGAVDGLSMVVPHGESEFYRARPTIAIPLPGRADASALDLDGFFGLNPRLHPLKPLWERGDLAIVHACGSPHPTRSHFDAQDYMESGTPGIKSTEDGWLNRCLQLHRAGDPSAFRAVALSPQLPRALQGAEPAVAMSRIDRFGIGGTAGTGTSFETQYAAAADRVLNGVGRETFEALRTLARTRPARYRPDHGAIYPASPFGQALKQIAQLIKAEVGVEVAFAEVGGWDTHVNQGGSQGQLAARLDDFARAVNALVTDLGERMADTVVLTMSEFGRAVAENGNRGTDHGHGNAMFVIGGGVRGRRVFGRWPGLGRESRHEGRDLAVTTDFRDVFGEVAVRHLGLALPAPVFPGYAIDTRRFVGLFG
jgi:uncharacterized protein (DUF1501 family)